VADTLAKVTALIGASTGFLTALAAIIGMFRRRNASE
jgi:hypothetical protein